MKRLIKQIAIVNLIAAIVVMILSQYVPAFETTGLSDFLFYIVIVVWAIAGLTWDGGRESRTWADDPAAKQSSSMVSGHDFKGDQQAQIHDNYQFGLMMFIAGLPALVGCIILRWFF